MSTRLDDPWRSDYYEREFVGYVRARFPAYERYWQEFIEPLREPGRTRLRAEQQLLRMAEAHYSVFWHLLTAYRLTPRLRSGTVDEAMLEARPAFEAVLFHLSAATEMVEEFLYAWAIIEARCADREEKRVCEELSRKQVLTRAGKQYDKNHKKWVTQLEEGKRDVQIYLQSRKDCLILPFLSASRHGQDGANPVWEAFEDVSQRVRNYRNGLAHGAVLATRLRGLELCVPTESLMRSRPTWTEVREKEDDAGFILAVNLVNRFQRRLERAINGLWVAVIPHCQQLAASEKYQEWLVTADRRPAAAGDDARGRVLPRRSSASSME